MHKERIFFQKKIIIIIITLIVYLAFPYIVTTFLGNSVKKQSDTKLINGRSVEIEYKNGTRFIDINEYIVMVIAKRFDMSQETEILKAESIMIRTDLYRLMGENMTINSKDTGLEFLSEKQMKTQWKDKYQENYEFIKDCVNATNNIYIVYNNMPIEARYTKVSSGKTLDGTQNLGPGYEYLVSVDCPLDMQSSEYLHIETISNKDFVKKFTKLYSQIAINESAPFGSIQIAAKTAQGYISKIQVGNVVMSGNEFAQILGLNSACFTIENMNDSLKITTNGVGSGFGVSMYTADIMAKQGNSYEQILKTFYGGIVLQTVPE